LNGFYRKLTALVWRATGWNPAAFQETAALQGRLALPGEVRAWQVIVA